MQYSHHCQSRANQRGIKKEVLELIDKLGRDFGDKVVLTRKNCQQFSEELGGFIRLINRIGKAGGSFEVSEDGSFLNAYRHTDGGCMEHLGQIRM